MMKRYIIIFFTSFTLVLLCVVILAWIVNPYDYWNKSRVVGLNLYKPAVGRHLSESKSRQLNRISPATVVVGNSRVDVGFDPTSDKWKESSRPIYNFGLPGVINSRILQVLRSAIENTKEPKNILLVLDFLDFRIRAAVPNIEASTISSSAKKLKFLSEILMSTDVLIDSISTILEQFKSNPATWRVDGFNGLAEYNSIVSLEGHRAIFDQRELANLQNFARADRSLGNSPVNHPEIEALDQFLSFAKKRGITVTIVTHPYHADILVAFRQLGIWQELNQWKLWMTQLSERHAVDLIDYANFSSPTQETVPVAGDTKTRLKYYWEAGHHKSAMGDIIVEEVEASEIKPNIGMRLHTSSLEKTLDIIEKRAEEYEAHNPSVVSRIEQRIINLN